MPKKVFAVTNVRVGPSDAEYFESGKEIDPSRFTKEQLMELHANGAIEVRVVDEEVAPDGTAVDSVVEGAKEGTPGDSGAGEGDADADA